MTDAKKPPADQMQAIVQRRYGGPEALRLETVARPTVSADGVLVRVRASSANPADWHIMRGEPFIARLSSGLRTPKIATLGGDVAGVVEAVGDGVTRFQPGDEVLGDLFGGLGFGGFAEYVATKEHALVSKPDNVSFEEAAATPLAGVTALQGVRDHAQVQAGQRVLVNGASGGVGTFAVQIAKHLGAEVTGVCSTGNVELVRSIGADAVIDYTQQDFSRDGQQYDAIIDNVGNRSIADYKRALAPGGIGIIIGFTTLRRLFGHALFGALSGRAGKPKVRLMGTAQSNPEDLALLGEWLATGAIVPVIDRTYPLAETAEAIRYLEAGHARGKVVITV